MTQSFHALPESGRSNFDIGPLSWVMEEIREALGQSRTALFDANTKGSDSSATLLNHALTYLHQAHGALQIIDVDGVTILTNAVEDILRRMVSEEILLNHANVRIIEQAYQAITEYLQELLSGDLQQPMRLFPYYKDLQEVRGAARIHPADLFFPDLENATASLIASSDLSACATGTALNYASLRHRFEKSLLTILLNQGAPGELDAAATLRDVVSEIELAQSNQNTREFWCVMHGFTEMMSAMTHPSTLFEKQVCGRINRQIKLLAQGSSSVSEKLLVDALYCLAENEQKTPIASRVRTAFQLNDIIPADFEKKRYGQIDSVALGMAKSTLSQAKNAWNRVTKGDADSTQSFASHLKQLAAACQRFNSEALAKLFQAIALVSDQIESGAPINDRLGFEIATSLLFAENTLDHLSRAPDDLQQRVDALVERLNRVAAGQEPPAATQWLDSLAHQSQQRQTVAVLATEMESSLRHIERILDEYHIDRTKHAALADIEPILHQIAGVLSILDQEDAMQAVLHTQTLIKQFHESGNNLSDNAISQPIPDAITQNITALGFFVEMLPQHPESARSRFVFDQEQGVFYANLLEKAAPRLAATRNADVTSDPLLDEESHAAPQHSAAPQPALQPDAENQPATDEEIDAELLEIFMTEAEEVLDFVKQTVPEARTHRDDQEQLTTLRRSFHTLKGSGRMVGLTAFAEAAYSIEQVMNLWLAESRAGTSDLFALLDKAADELGNWVDDLKISGKSNRTPLALTNAAELVKSGEAYHFDDVLREDVAQADFSEPVHARPEIVDITADAHAVDGATDVHSSEAEAHFDAEELPPELPPTRSNVIEFPAVPALSSADDDNIKRIGDLKIPVPLYNIFVAEADDILRFLTQDFSEWRHEQNRTVSTRAIHAAHTLAGISATVGFTTLHDTAHALEGYLETLECQPMALTSATFDILQDCVEQMKQMQQRIAISELPLPRLEIQQQLRNLQQDAATPAASAPTLVETDTNGTNEVSLSPSLSVPKVSQDSPDNAEEDDSSQVIRDDIDPDLLPVFLDEGRDLLPPIGEALRNWLHAPSDTSSAPEILRLLHTAKGSARMAGAMVIGQHLHMMESHIEDALHSDTTSRHILEELLARHDYSMQLFDHLQHPEVEIAPYSAPQHAEHGEPAENPASESALLPASQQPPRATSSPPPIPAAPVARVRVRADVLDRLVNQAGEVSISRSKIENEVDSLRLSLSDLTDNLSRLRSQLREVEIQAESQITSRMAQSSEREFDPLEFDRYSRLQELTRMMTESVDDVASIQDSLMRTVSGATSDLENQAQLTRSLQQDLMQVRMVPFSSIAERLYQITRQTAKEVAKSVNIDIRGTSVEIDRSVLERMIGPLEHLLRNAIVHGIESRADRKAAGKNETGELLVEIRQEGNEVVIQLSDDGNGLDLVRIREKALTSGLISAEHELTQSELEDLIFQSGFTTAGEVTEVAGRGVGMDVVRSETASLGGRISIHSESGKGTAFTINLPLTLAVSSVVLLSSGGNAYAIPSVLVEQVQQLRSRPLAEAHKAGGIIWMNEHVPIHFLSTLLGDLQTPPLEQQYTPVLILKSGNVRVAVQVDAIIGNREVVVKNIGPQLARMIGIVGATVLGSGNIVLILNPVALAHRVVREQPLVTPQMPDAKIHDDRAAIIDADATATLHVEQVPVVADATALHPSSDVSHAAATYSTHKKSIVMVVDDSLTVRRVTQRFLQREGYQVILAKDGVDALEKLQEVKPDVMLVDIEMPRMDGFDLIRNVRGDSRIAKTPIIMITSRTASKHRNYAMELGANEYYGKPFQEAQLLESIEEFVGKGEEAVD